MKLSAGLALVLLIPAVAGCGSQPPTGSASGATASASNDAPFQYARCIRAHGVPSFPDPLITTTPGSTSVRQMAPASVANAPKFKTAEKACQSLEPGPNSGSSDHHGPSGAVLLAFTRCLRSHGLSGFPDPDRNGRISPQMISAAGINLRGPAFLSAARACIGVTHGAITAADVLAAAKGPH
jgi:hypothetical protein